jgi:hypothetical protein
MRDGEYIALKLYTEDIIKERNLDLTLTGVLKNVLFGELPPIPHKYLEIGEREAKLLREERAKNLTTEAPSEAPSEAQSKAPEKEKDEFRRGGHIFTF